MAFGSTEDRVNVVLVLDNSMSTARKLGGSTVFDKGIEVEAARLIHQLNAVDTVRVLSDLSRARMGFRNAPKRGQ